MRASLLALVLIGAGVIPALGDDAPLTAPPRKTVYLDGPRDLARLQATNPDHYARAQRILAAANELCRPGAGELQPIGRSRDVRCVDMLLLTSNPPQRRVTFTLDDTRYIALVVITDDAARLIPAR
jgi:hypothetical protein